MKRLLPLAALVLSTSLSGTVTEAQVPVADLLKRLKSATQSIMSGSVRAKDEENNEARLGVNDLHQQQLAAIDEALASMNVSNFAPMELESLEAAPAEIAYDTSAVTSEDSRLFGDARLTVEQMISETATKYQGHPALTRAGITPAGFRSWFQALVKQESGFQIRVCSHKGACGLTQIMPGTFDYLGIPKSQRNDPRVQLDGGARYLLEQLNSFGSMPLALAAYNAGPGAVQKYNGIPPYRETQDYVVKITGYASKYAAIIGSPADLGTMSSADMPLAEVGNISDAGMTFGYGMSNQVAVSAQRIKILVSQIPTTQTTLEAIQLNTYLRGEITRLASMMTIMEAAQRRVEAQRFGAIYRTQIEDEEFLSITGG